MIGISLVTEFARNSRVASQPFITGSDMSIKITGYQWKWRYDYIDEGFGFYSTLDRASDAARQLGSGIDPRTVENYLLEVDKPLVVPVDAKVRLLITAADVIHAQDIAGILPCMVAKRASGTPIVTTYHSSELGEESSPSTRPVAAARGSATMQESRSVVPSSGSVSPSPRCTR